MFNNYFSQNSDIHNHNTRTALNIHCSYARTSIRAASIGVCGPVIWNELPNYVRVSPTLIILKQTLKCYLLSLYCPTAPH